MVGQRLAYLLAKDEAAPTDTPAVRPRAEQQAAAPTTPETDLVRLVVQKRFTNIPLLIADAGGFFEREGLRIERVPLDSGSDALPLLIRGQVDAAAMTSTVNLL